MNTCICVLLSPINKKLFNEIGGSGFGAKKGGVVELARKNRRDLITLLWTLNNQYGPRGTRSMKTLYHPIYL